MTIHFSKGETRPVFSPSPDGDEHADELGLYETGDASDELLIEGPYSDQAGAAALASHMELFSPGDVSLDAL